MIPSISLYRCELRKAQSIKLQKPTDQADRTDFDKSIGESPSTSLVHSKEIRHGLRRSSGSWAGCKSKCVAYRPQQVLMMVERLRFEIALYFGADHEGCDTASAISGN